MSADLKIDVLTGDFSVSSSGKLNEVTGINEVIQRVRTRLSKQLGEWKFNLASGIPWLYSETTDGILGSSNGRDIAQVYIQETVLATDGVTALNSINSTVNTASRSVTFQLDIETVFGNAVISI